MTEAFIRKRLEEMAEPEFQRFSSALIPNLAPGFLLGVRLPALRKLAREIAKGNPKQYLREAGNDSFEEIMLQGMVIGYIKGNPQTIFPLVEAFLPKIDNWSVCDSFCSGLKLAREYPKEMWAFLTPLFQEQREYYVRFAVVMLIFYYIKAEYLRDIFHILDRISLNAYYVKTAVAWAVSTCYREFPGETMWYLNHNSLEPFTYQKSLQKILESVRTDETAKKQIRGLKERAKNAYR